MTKGEWHYESGVLIIHVLKSSDSGSYVVYDPEQERPFIVHTWSEGMKPEREADFYNLQQAMTLAESFT